MHETTTIRPATKADAILFPDIEQSAGELFRLVPDLAWIADSENLTDPRYAELIGKGASWVAVTGDDSLVGFLCGEVMEGELHIHELGVALDVQRRGIGRALLETAMAWARQSGLAAVTLTTFRDVPWNEPFYAGAGFETLSDASQGARLAAIMDFEIGRGLPRERRCAMRRLIREPEG